MDRQTLFDPDLKPTVSHPAALALPLTIASVALSVLSQRVDESEAGRFSVLMRGDGPDLDDVPSLD